MTLACSLLSVGNFSLYVINGLTDAKVSERRPPVRLVTRLSRWRLREDGGYLVEVWDNESKLMRLFPDDWRGRFVIMAPGSGATCPGGNQAAESPISISKTRTFIIETFQFSHVTNICSYLTFHIALVFIAV